jgi:Flp pilus assembly protein TadB
LSKRVLVALPFVLFIVLNIMNPKYMQPFLHDNIGVWMLIIGGALLMSGMWIMHRMAALKY